MDGITIASPTLFRLDAVDLTFKYVFQGALYRRLERLARAPIRRSLAA
jgi:hypothetical protein